MKIVINACHGGFGLSEAAILRFAEINEFDIYPEPVELVHHTQIYWLVPPSERVDVKAEFSKMSRDERIAYNELYGQQTFYHSSIPRNDPVLVQVVEELGDKVNTRYSKLKVIDIPDDVEWEVQEYDGYEWIAEKHRTWGDE